MEVDEDEGVLGSQPLFDVSSVQRIDATIKVSEEKEIVNSQNSCDRQHWLFQKNKDYIAVTHPRKNDRRHHVSVKELQDNLNMYVDGISKVQCSLDPVAWTKSVKADKSVSVTDDISYLFRSDTMRFKKTVLLKTLKQSGKRNGEQNPMQDTSYFDGGAATSRYPRRAKNKLHLFAEETSDDDDFLSITDKPSQLRTNGGKEKFAKNRKTILIDSLPNINLIKYSKNELDVPNVDSASQSMKKSVNSEFQPTKKRKVEIGQPSTLFTKTKQFVSSFMSKKSNDESEHAENKIIDLEDSEVIEKEDKQTKGKKEIKKISCPMCDKLFSNSDINNHAYQCQGPVPLVTTRNRSGCSTIAEDTGSNYNYSAWQSACKGLNQSQSAGQPDLNVIDDESIKKYTKQNIWQETGSQSPNTKSSKRKKAKQATEQTFVSDDEDPVPSVIKRGVKAYFNRNNNFIDTKKTETIKRIKIEDHVTTNFITDDESDNDDIYGLETPKQPVNNTKKAFRRTFGESQDENDGHKCYKCEKLFMDDDTFNSHTKLCLSNSILAEKPIR